jgi:large subunit ribosomal protein L10
MATEKKIKAVEELQEVFSKASIGILTDYRGLKTSELNELRSKLRDANIEYKVVKNSLAQIAAKNAGLAHLEELFQGPVAVLLSSGDVSQAAKVLADYIRTTKSTLGIKGGFLPDTVLSDKDLDALAKLPSREVLIARVIGGMQSPIYGLVNVLAGPIRGIMGVLQARIQQLEGN